ncbi:hypothetical protein HD806DRAFT_533397 [Xylariaceae sp. AK1471]|nr:hypothetical protein HD806DRAFT_533397 [Xylariaceae sp. AK1471]
MSFRQITTVAVLALASISSAKKGVEKPAGQPTIGTDVVVGCFSSLGGMKLQTTYMFNTQSYCAPICRKNGMPVGATYARECYCGSKLPNNKTLLDDSKCNEPCPGFDTDACGGLNAYTVYNTGVQVNVAEAEDDTTSTTSASSTSTATTKASNIAESTTTPSATPTPTATSESKPSKVGIAVGVVVGVLVVASIAVGLFFFVRRRRNAELEEEHRRNAAVNAFISGGKPPGSSGGMSMADSRMDPVLNRRLSDGSIADNQDYSRRILRVTNA